MFFKKILLPSAGHHEERRGDADGKHTNHNWPQTQQNGDQMPMAQVAVVDHYHGGKGGVSFTYSEFREHIRDTAAGLQHFGLAKGVADLVAAG